MTTLRILCDTAPDLQRAVPWALFDAQGRRLAHGRDAPAAWPAADRIEAVVGAGAVRIVALELPRLPPDRVAATAAFALEDRLAAPEGALHIAVSAQDSSGRVLVTIVDRERMRALARHVPAFARIVAEPALSPVAQGWRWSATADRGGFVRRADGSAFPLDAPGSGDALPPELELGLAEARRAGAAPQRIAVAGAVDDARLKRWSRATGVAFVRGQERAWDEVDGAAWAAATDLLQGEFARAPRIARGRLAGSFVPALAIALLALALHLLATAGTWTRTEFERWRIAGNLADLARAAGAKTQLSPDAAATTIERRYAELRHRAGLTAPDDALPLLARAAPALGALPGGALKSASYAAGAWTIELAPLPAPALAQLEQRLAAAGLVTLQAATPAGIRMRVGQRVAGS